MDIAISQRPRRGDRPPEDPQEWIVAGDTGISSRVIWAVMMHVSLDVMPKADIPHDPLDFGRCYRLLEIMPEWRDRLDQVVEKCPKWAPLVEHWDELEEMYEACLDEAGRYRGGTEQSRAMYERMKELLDK